VRDQSDAVIRDLLARAVKDRAGAEAIRARLPFCMLSNEELSFLDGLLRAAPSPPRLIAELGTYVGGTTVLMGAATPPTCRFEVYDLFEHNKASRKRLSDDPLFDPVSFYTIWERNTAALRDRIDLKHGDILQSYKDTTEPLDLLYVDIVKHHSLVNAMIHFYDRLQVGGILLHQDYFHWQSPWLVYQMESLLPWFELLGDAGMNMTVYRKLAPLPAEALAMDFLTGIPDSEKLALFDRAIARYNKARAGMLRVSRLRLQQQLGQPPAEAEMESVAADFADSARVSRYLEAFRRAPAVAKLW
jgi:predicted O-methyltransferase YrrM